LEYQDGIVENTVIPHPACPPELERRRACPRECGGCGIQTPYLSPSFDGAGLPLKAVLLLTKEE